jgi:hypothetical protein
LAEVLGGVDVAITSHNVFVSPLTGNVVIGETPLPAALPLFAGGLGALGLLGGWRRKRTARSVAA